MENDLTKSIFKELKSINPIFNGHYGEEIYLMIDCIDAFVIEDSFDLDLLADMINDLKNGLSEN